MKKPKVYIDGQAGTTGLQIRERLESRDDIELLVIDEEKRHDLQERRKIMKEADLVFFCLPDTAALEAADLAEDLACRIIDASTAHRTSWTYGFAELSAAHEEAIKKAKRVANPGCHASGFIALAYPLIASGLIDSSAQLSAFSLTGYTGGGKGMIAEYENENRDPALDACRVYGLNMNHKHIPEMTVISGLETAPLFTPVVADYPRGMAVSLQLPLSQLEKEMSAADLRDFYASWYENQPLIDVEMSDRKGMINAASLAGKDNMTILVNGNDNQVILTALFDNLGKGASGAAVENMNLMLGFEKERGLVF